MGAPQKIVLAYSGGLDTSVILRWLINEYHAEVIAYAADVGQGEELAPLREKALATGASEFVLADLREEFVRDFVFPTVQANAVYEGTYLLGTSIARPLIAKRHVDIARETGADALCHGATGKGNDQVRFELTYQALAPELQIIAPWRTWEFKGRADLITYAQDCEIPITVTIEKPYSMDRNLFHCSYEGGILEDPWRAPDAGMFQLSVAPEAAPDTPTMVEVTFADGVPVAVDGDTLAPVPLLERLNAVAGANGIGRIDIVENRFVGVKSRGVYETPGGTVLHIAHRAVESITMDREVMNLRDSLIPRFAEMIYNGFWYAPEGELLRSLVQESQRGVSGVVRLKLYKGNVIVEGRKSDRSLYREDFVTFEADDVYDQADATGFIRLNALRLRIRALAGRGPAS